MASGGALPTDLKDTDLLEFLAGEHDLFEKLLKEDKVR
jgi:hypothetical protein